MSSGDSNLGTVSHERKVVAMATALLMRDFGYTDPKVLGAGSFGTVLSLRCPKREANVAIKFVSLEGLREGEDILWSELAHPNIVPLLGRILLSTINVACFQMNPYPQELMTVVKKDEFLTSTEALDQMKTWLHQVLRGLNFLHKRQLCHLDIKSDNIFISRHTSTAKIGDFGFLSRRPSHIGSDDIGLPYMYRPPESLELKDDEFINGKCFDLWSYGIMVLEMLTSFHIAQSLYCCYLGKEARNASLRVALQEDVFIQKMKIALPKVEITHTDAQIALAFLQSYLKTNPSTRMTTDIGLHHKFLRRGDVANAEVVSLWKLPNAEEERICGPVDNRHENEDSIPRERQTHWFWRWCSDLQKLFTRCLPCVK